MAKPHDTHLGLLDALHSALRASHPMLAGASLQAMADKGLAHHHVRLAGTGVIARLPKQSQMGLGAQANLDYQAACFERAGVSGHTPSLHGVLPPSALLPRGGLLVEEIHGRPARLPQDLPAIGIALAAIHSIPLPDAPQRAPLRDPADSLKALRDEIDAQAVHLQAAQLEPRSRRVIASAFDRVERATRGHTLPPPCLITFDAHPGNFLLRDDGRAVLVDLEKARYGEPPLDLAHATLYTSTTWDTESYAELSVPQVVNAYEAWAQHFNAAASWRPWFVPLRAAMWLWAVTWCAKWLALSGRQATPGGDGEDWSRERSEDSLVQHVRERVACYLSDYVIAEVGAELMVLEREFE
ncbi:MAG: aminoglycoside phosphotransferase family protein [Burkholderiaceae bacterium]